MAEVKILIEGYTSADQPAGEGDKTCPTMTLVRDGEFIIIVDPGVLEEQQILIDKLAALGIAVADVNLVFITHSHLDHYRNIGLFPRAKTLEFWGLWSGSQVQPRPTQVTPDIEVIGTPGHSADSLNLLVTTNLGKIAICGDVFWKEGQPRLDPYASDPAALTQSRQTLLDSADWIIPGHGPMFKVK